MIKFSKVVVKSVVNIGITSDGIQPLGRYSLNVIGPVPSDKLPVPKLVPSNVKLVTVAHITNLSFDLVGSPDCNLLFASKY